MMRLRPANELFGNCRAKRLRVEVTAWYNALVVLTQATLLHTTPQMKHFLLALAAGVALCASCADAQTFKTLLALTGTGGTASSANPVGSLIVSGSTLYGMTSGRANNDFNNDGNIFSVDSNGTNFQNLVSFTGTSGGTASGSDPQGSLIASAGMLYGMTFAGGIDGFGNVFSVGLNGTNYQNLVSFTGTSGSASGQWPSGSLIASGGTLYGMTASGGAYGYGNIFSVGTNGTNYQNLVSFTGTGGTASGLYPNGSLIANGGTLYGMTQGVGLGGSYGNIFSVATNGTNYRNVVSFTSTGGAATGDGPVGSLILSGTTLYGMTSTGGVDGWGNIFSVGVDGSGYQDLYDFTGGADGGNPGGDLLLSSGTLFGITIYGGANNYGTVFALTVPAPVPEPGTLALAGTGGAAVLVSYCWRRRRRRRGHYCIVTA
jgi:uncharacterized repeat protein (TIGR03803 family)